MNNIRTLILELKETKEPIEFKRYTLDISEEFLPKLQEIFVNGTDDETIVIFDIKEN